MESPSLHHRQTLHTELAAARAEFVSLVHGFSEQDVSRPSLNPGWSNAEILAHILFGFMITNSLMPLARLWGRLPPESSRWFAGMLNSFTRPFNWINGLGARGQARVFTQQRIPRLLERAVASLDRHIDSIGPTEWQRGMYYPDKWDPGFDKFMTVEKLFRYPIRHFHFHLGQLAR